MAGKWHRIGATVLILWMAGCAKKQAPPPPPAPPAPKQNVFALLPEPEGNPSAIVVRNSAGAQDLSQSNQAVRVERADVAPTAPFPLTDADVRRLFGSALDVLPGPELAFTLHFDLGEVNLTPESQAQVPAILNAIRDRHSTAITVTGHTDTVRIPEGNYRLGMRRAQLVADKLRGVGVKDDDLIVSSHGDADLLVKTGPGINEPLNRRVEVIVR
jgi:outer membrane protein OmpA-like peptidoglycan-associated protein